MTKTELRKRLRAAGQKDSDAAIAAIFGIFRQAVQLWPDDAPIPELRELQLQVRRPDLCGSLSAVKRRAAQAAAS